MIKKFICCLFALAAVIQCYGCSVENKDNTSNSHVHYEPSEIRVTFVSEVENPFGVSNISAEISEDFKAYILSLWNNAQWEEGYLKSTYDCVFEFDGTDVKYVWRSGMFNDMDNNRHFYLSEEDRKRVDSLLEETLSQHNRSDSQDNTTSKT